MATAIRDQAYCTKTFLMFAKMPPRDLLAKKRAERYLEEELLMTVRKSTCGREKNNEHGICSGIDQKSRKKTRTLISCIARWFGWPYGELGYKEAEVLIGLGQSQTYMIKFGRAQLATYILCVSKEEDVVDHTICLSILDLKNPHWTKANKVTESTVKSEKVRVAGLAFFSGITRKATMSRKDLHST